MKLAERVLSILKISESMSPAESKKLMGEIKSIKVKGAEGKVDQASKIEKKEFKSVEEFEKALMGYDMPESGYNKMLMLIKFENGDELKSFRYDHGKKDPSFSKQLDMYLQRNVSL